MLVALFAASVLSGQQSAFERLNREAARTKAASSDDDHAVAVTPLHLAMRDWIESRLPQERGGTATEFSQLEATLRGELQGAGLSAPDTPITPDDGPEGPGIGYIGFEFKRLPELPDALFVIVGASVECGADNAIYMYRFGASGLTRVLEDHPRSESRYAGATLALSDPDTQGRRLLLTHYMSSQCQSSWMEMAYSVYRLGLQSGPSELLLAGTHSFWLENEPEFVLKPEELIMEFLDSSVDVEIHNRTRIHRYSFGQGVQRLDPVALQPQDFAEEWLTRPWSEMQSRSAGETQEWHERLHGDYVLADYSSVTTCAARRGRWLIALDVTPIGDRELKDRLRTYFLVHDLGSYHYNMEAVSEFKPEGCLDRGHASEKHPWLTTTELKALTDRPQP